MISKGLIVLIEIHTNELWLVVKQSKLTIPCMSTETYIYYFLNLYSQVTSQSLEISFCECAGEAIRVTMFKLIVDGLLDDKLFSIKRSFTIAICFSFKKVFL